MIKLPKTTYTWALKHLLLEGDTDLFPRPFELEALKYNWSTIVAQLGRLDLANYVWSSGRKFIVYKGGFAFRNATQLEPLDSLIFASIVKHIGKRIEKARPPVSEKRVFSYRFDPQSDGRLYGKENKWHEFWQGSLFRARKPGVSWVAIADITDYYNQIYHHAVQRQLVQAGVRRDLADLIERQVLGKTTHGISRGVPIGPHSSHIFAECALIPIDQSLLARGQEFCRYVDDYHFFCSTEE